MAAIRSSPSVPRTTPVKQTAAPMAFDIVRVPTRADSSMGSEVIESARFMGLVINRPGQAGRAKPRPRVAVDNSDFDIPRPPR